MKELLRQTQIGKKSAVQGHFEKQSRKHKCTQNTATSRFFIGKMKKA